MAKDRTKSQRQSAPHPVTPHPALKLCRTLQKHTDIVHRMALSPDGCILASPSRDRTVRLWNMESGRVLKTLEHHSSVLCVAWSPDGMTLATGTDNAKKVFIWDATTGRHMKTLDGHWGRVNGVAWSPDGKILASCSDDQQIVLWNTMSGRLLRKLKGSTTGIQTIAWSPDGRRLCSSTYDIFTLWNPESGEEIRRLKGHNGYVLSLAWAPNGPHVASSSQDKTVRIWDAEAGHGQYVLEGHTGQVVSVSFLDGGRLLASLGHNGTVIFWRTDTWAEVLRVEQIGVAGNLANLAIHPSLPVMAVRGESRNEINIWNLDLALLRGAEPTEPTVFYVNAKAVLLGESGVGKSGLAIRIADKKFRTTESTHGAHFWHFPTEELPAFPSAVQAELTLWDLAGQPEYRLTHQLFLDDTDAALLLFDCSDANDPFRGVPYWAKVLKRQAPPHAKKFLVSARCDVSPVTVDRSTINRMLATYGLDEYFKTSAKTGEGVERLFERLMSEIPWNKLPRTSTPKLFQVMREFLLERKQTGPDVITMEEVRQAAAKLFQERPATQAELDTVIQLLQSRGLVHRLELRPDVTWVLLKPERINQYGASIIQAARNHPQGIGAVPERDVLTGNIIFAGFERLRQAEETLVLEGTAELLIRRDLGFREMGYLVFPSQINITRQVPNEAHPRTEVAYRFSGSIETIYASLVVRLSYTNYFRREDQWKYAVEFSRDDNRLGFSMRQIEEGTGELEIYFQTGISEFDRVTFIRFVTDHLRGKGIDIEEQIRLYCPKCSEEVTTREAIETRIRDGKLDIPCVFCDTAILIPKSVEEIYRRDPSLGNKQRQLVKTVEQRTESEVEQFRADQRQYTATEDQRIHILHLSDLHFTDDTFADVWRSQLETDLKQELGVLRLEYLIISGDVANYSTEKEYDVAFAMVDGLVKRFGLDASRVVVVPGNHDLNWDLSEEAYPFVSKRKLPSPLPADHCIPAGEAGALLRDDALYRDRFAHFNTHFYRRVYSGQDYPTEYADQALFIERPEDKILFLGLNSSWQLDHHFRKRASIHIPALSRALDRLQDGKYDGWLKAAVWHHPITGKEMMNDEFMQLLAVHGFQICLHGHIHEAIQGFHHYDDRRGIRIIGAGTFGAPANEQVTGIPLQYNLLTFDPKSGEMMVNTRKKEKPEGAWSADARWGDKNDPKGWYHFSVPNYQFYV
jgi:small GTP-binding protein